MRYITYLLLACVLATSVSAYMYVTPSSYSYVTAPAYSGYSYGNYYRMDGYRLTQPGPYPYPRSYVYAEDRLGTGHYSGYTGRYHSGYTGGQIPYATAKSTGYPARYYPQLNTVHWE